MSDTSPIAIIWLRQCLRLSDNPMLAQALAQGLTPVFVYCWSPEEEGDWPPGAASRWWLHHSLQALAEELAKRGSRLILRSGRITDVLSDLIQQTGAVAVFADARVEPAARVQEAKLQQDLLDRFGQSLTIQFFWSNVLVTPGAVLNQQREPYQVYSAFWRAMASHVEALQDTANPLRLPDKFQSPVHWPESHALASLKLLPALGWDAEFSAHWQPGEAGAQKSLKHFLAEAINHYATQRDLPATLGTSILSPHLHFGEISPRQILKAVTEVIGTQTASQWVKGDQAQKQSASAIKFIKEVGWREFAVHLLWHFPQMVTEPLRASFKHFDWRQDEHQLACWQAGQTGYPIVDAGMRQLWRTGWMHNRVRMIVGSFLVKDLRLHWHEGARWFWETLVDADLASNTMGWQWISGCGADAAPYFRVFNPWLQSQKFDAEGRYLRRWLPELSNLSPPMIHNPSQFPALESLSEGISNRCQFPARLRSLISGRYPMPIVDHATAKAASLEAFQNLKTSL